MYNLAQDFLHKINQPTLFRLNQGLIMKRVPRLREIRCDDHKKVTFLFPSVICEFGFPLLRNKARKNTQKTPQNAPVRMLSGSTEARHCWFEKSFYKVLTNLSCTTKMCPSSFRCAPFCRNKNHRFSSVPTEHEQLAKKFFAFWISH